MPVPANEKAETRPNTVYIGMASSLFPSMPETALTAVLDSFGVLMESQTGLTGRIVAGGDAVQLGEMLAEGKVKLGVFHGIEFGWAQQKYPDLRPLMMAVNQERQLQAFIMVRDNAEGTELTTLKGKTMAISKGTRHHCNLFLDRRCQELGQEPSAFFGKIETHANSEKVLDQVVDGAVECALVDSLSADCYKRRKPVRHAKLKALERSPMFPAAVVAYNPNTSDDATLRKFREGMLNANKTMAGRHMMTLFKLTAFEPVSSDYDTLLSEILKRYPAPAGGAGLQRDDATK
jgi:ABC-type phosphate/phosphonate transport system substrate-binding protein